MNFTSSLKGEYDRLWGSCAVRSNRRQLADALADRIVANRARYEAAGKPHGVPWYVVGIIHMLESSGNFKTHLHNGDPLTARTVRVPAGCPRGGRPPFAWEASASDALVHTGLDRWTDWSVPATLYVFERYNGFGYRKASIGINSPYLWSFSSNYERGKYVADGKYSPTAVSEQCGAAVLLKTLADRGLVTGAGTGGGGPAVLKRPLRSPAVKTLKQQLRAWFEATAPGEWARFGIVDNDAFGAGLEKAVKAFQERNGLEDDGEVGRLTREKLAEVAPAAAPAATRQPASVEPPATPVGAANEILARGAKGPAVTELKKQLKAWFDAASPGQWERFGIADNDVFGAGVEKAVKTFQQRAGLKDDGEVGPLTRTELALKPRKPAAAPATTLKDLGFPGALARDATGEKVRLLQGWLSLNGANVVVDGGLGPATETALKAFRSKRGLGGGALNQKTWDALVAPMVRALEPVGRQDALGKVVLAVAKQHLKEHPREVGGQNRGPWVRLYTDGREGNECPWCAAFASWCVKQAADALGVAPPLSRTLACDVMAREAGARFVDGSAAGARGRLRPGSIFLQRSRPEERKSFRYRHTGIVVEAGAETMSTIEGNTNDDGSAEGYEVCARTRGYKDMDFIVL